MRLLFRLTSIQKQRFLTFMAATSSTKASPRVYLQVLGAQTEDTSPSLFIFADSQRYNSLSLIKKTAFTTIVVNFFEIRRIWNNLKSVYVIYIGLTDTLRRQYAPLPLPSVKHSVKGGEGASVHRLTLCRIIPANSHTSCVSLTVTD